MADAQEEAPLATGSLAGSEEVLVPSVVPRGSNSRALKVAGLTTLACLLLASQVFMAYMVFDQKQQIHTLQKNSDKLSRQMTRTSQVVPARMPLQSMNSLLMDVSVDQHSLSTKSTTKTSKTPTTPNQQVTDDSVEKQLTDLMKDFKLPQFNETFLANMQSLRKQMNMSDWKTLETWMRNWLIFQTAQQEPAAPTASSIQTKCQQAAGKMLGSYKPQCDEQGRYLPVQCWHATGFCWCVDESGETIQGTEIRGRPTCPGAAAPLAKMAVPSLMQAVAIDEN